MSRHSRHRPWQHIALCAGAAALASTATIGAFLWAYRAANAALYAAGAILAIGTILLVVLAGSWIAATGWYAVRLRFLDAAARRYAPPKRVLRGVIVTADGDQAEGRPADPIEPAPADVVAADHWCWEDPTLPHARPAVAAYDPRSQMATVAAAVGISAEQESPF